MTVTYYDGDSAIKSETGQTRREALARHGDSGGTGLEYARHPAGGRYMAATDGAVWSVHRTGNAGTWGPWCRSLSAAREAVRS